MLLFSDWVKKQEDLRKEIVIISEKEKQLTEKYNQDLMGLKSEKDNFENRIGDILKQVGEEKAKINIAIDNLNASFSDICSFEFEDGKIIVVGDDEAIVDAYCYSENSKSFVQDETIAICNFINRNKRIAYCKKVDLIYSELDKI